MYLAQFKKVIQSLDRAKNTLYTQYSKDSTTNLRHPKDHWIGWLQSFREEGYYKRKRFGNVRVKSIYNSLHCPNMLIWLAEASGVPEQLIYGSLSSIDPIAHPASICGTIRKAIPWELIEKYLVVFNNTKTNNPTITPERSFSLPKRITKKWAQEFLEYQKWRTSVNPYTRHQYLFKERLLNENSVDIKTLRLLEDTAEWIHQKGTYYTWKNKITSYMFLGEYKYWVMWYTDGSLASINRWKITGAEILSTKEEIKNYKNSLYIL